MSPALTKFLSALSFGTHVLVCFQNAEGGIVTVSDTVKELFWTDGSSAKQNGINVGIRFAGKHHRHAPLGGAWGTHILAISEVTSSSRSRSERDPLGKHFIKMLWYN
jgi:hypothetical protein